MASDVRKRNLAEDRRLRMATVRQVTLLDTLVVAGNPIVDLLSTLEPVEAFVAIENVYYYQGSSISTNFSPISAYVDTSDVETDLHSISEGDCIPRRGASQNLNV